MKILFASDISFSRMEEQANTDTLHTIASSVKPVFDSADFRMVNQECIFYDGDAAPIIKSGPNIKCGKGFIEFLKFLNVDAAALANNHTGDFGPEAVTECIKYIKSNGIATLGAGANLEEAYKAHVFEKDGMKVSVIAVCENEFGSADDNKAGSAGYNLGLLSEKMKEEKAKSDFTVIYFHGGNEKNPFPSPMKVDLYRHFIDFGADAVIAMHTHCPQGYEYYNGKPIVYSMGNFYFPRSDMPDDDTWRFGYLSMLDFSKDGVKLEIFPYRTYGQLNNLELLEGEKKEKFMAYLDQITRPIGDRAKIKHLFKIWAAVSGSNYSKAVNFAEEMTDDAEKTRRVKNIFGCEAHNELIREFLFMSYNGEIAKYLPLWDEVNKYRKITL